MIPFKLGFLTVRAKPRIWLVVVQIFVDSLLISDLFVNMRAAYFNKQDELVVSRQVPSPPNPNSLENPPEVLPGLVLARLSRGHTLRFHAFHVLRVGGKD